MLTNVCAGRYCHKITADPDPEYRDLSRVSAGKHCIVSAPATKTNSLENMLQCSPWYLHSCTEHAHTRIALCSQWVTTIRWNSDGHLHTGGGILTLLDITDYTDYLTRVLLHHVGLELSLKVLMRQQTMFSRNISISCWVEAKCVESIPCIWFTYRGLMLSCWAQESRHQDPLSSLYSLH